MLLSGTHEYLITFSQFCFVYVPSVDISILRFIFAVVIYLNIIIFSFSQKNPIASMNETYVYVTLYRAYISALNVETLFL